MPPRKKAAAKKNRAAKKTNVSSSPNSVKSEPEKWLRTKRDLEVLTGMRRNVLEEFMRHPKFPSRGEKGWLESEVKAVLAAYRTGAVETEIVLSEAESALTENLAGAPSTLKRLEIMERKIGIQFMAAAKAKDYEEMIALQKPWLELASKVRDFERIIDKDARDSGEIIERSEVEEFVRLLGQAVGYAEEAFLDLLAIAITEMGNPRDPREVRQKVKGLLYDKMAENFDMACADDKFPRWLPMAMAEGMRPAPSHYEGGEGG